MLLKLLIVNFHLNLILLKLLIEKFYNIKKLMNNHFIIFPVFLESKKKFYLRFSKKVKKISKKIWIIMSNLKQISLFIKSILVNKVFNKGLIIGKRKKRNVILNNVRITSLFLLYTHLLIQNFQNKMKGRKQKDFIITQFCLC
jgi:hypothetical protein